LRYKAFFVRNILVVISVFFTLAGCNGTTVPSDTSKNKFRLTAYNPPSKIEYNGEYPNSSFDDVWQYYKDANLETISRIDPNNKGLFESAKKHGLKYYIDIRHIFFEDVLDSNGVDYLRGVQNPDDENASENVEPEEIPQSILDRVKKLVKKYKDDPDLDGYWVCDEPFPTGYKNIAKVIKTIKDIDPKHLSIVNIGRNEATTESNITRFLKTTDIKMFSFNFSIFWTKAGYDKWETTEKEQVEAYYKRFDMMRKLALDNNRSFGFIAQMVGTENNDPENIKWRTPTDEEDRWEAYTALVYGVHSLSWFFWEFDGDSDKGWGLLDKPQEQREHIYSAIQSVNKEINKLKDIMATLTSVRVYHNDTKSIEHRPVIAEDSDSRIIVGLFEKTDKRQALGKHYFMLVNKDYKEEITENYYIKVLRSEYPDAPADDAKVSLEYFDTTTNSWKDVKIKDNKFTAYLDAGEGKLFRFEFVN